MFRNVIAAFIVAAATGIGVYFYVSTESQERRDRQQADTLVQMEALRNPAVSYLVSEWRDVYPEPSQDKLTELCLICERVKAAATSASDFTTEAQQTRLDKTDMVSLVGGAPHAGGPGLD